MGNSVAKRTTTTVKRLPPIAEVVVEIRGHFYDAASLEERADSQRLQAAQKLLSLRQRIEAGEEGDVAWWDWFETQDLGRGRKDCERLMQIASAKDPEQALLDERERVRLAVADSRARKKAEADVTVTSKAKVIAVYGEDDGTTEEETRASMRANGFLNRAKESAEMAEADDLEGIKITEEIYRAAYRAMAAWQKIYTSLRVDPAPRPPGGGSGLGSIDL